MTDAVSRQAVLDLTASEITRRAIKDLQAVPSLDVEAAVRRALEKAAQLCEDANLEIWEYSTGNRGRIGFDANAEAIRAFADNSAALAHIMDAKP